jgi:hypothetical protein
MEYFNITRTWNNLLHNHRKRFPILKKERSFWAMRTDSYIVRQVINPCLPPPYG